MFRRLLNSLRSRRVLIRERLPLKPFEFLGSGLVRFDMSTMHRVEEIANLAAYHREQMEALAAECCELLGCEVNGPELDTDYATEIVYMGTPIEEALDNIITYKKLRDKQCQ